MLSKTLAMNNAFSPLLPLIVTAREAVRDDKVAEICVEDMWRKLSVLVKREGRFIVIKGYRNGYLDSIDYCI